MGQKLGHEVMIVIEKISEVDLLLKLADEMGIQPTAGVRIKLSAGGGPVVGDGGEKSKFGLSASELMRVIEKLRAAGAPTSSRWSTSTWARRSRTCATSRRR
jgi:arginine decarboxylase